MGFHKLLKPSPETRDLFRSPTLLKAPSSEEREAALGPILRCVGGEGVWCYRGHDNFELGVVIAIAYSHIYIYRERVKLATSFSCCPAVASRVRRRHSHLFQCCYHMAMVMTSFVMYQRT